MKSNYNSSFSYLKIIPNRPRHNYDSLNSDNKTQINKSDNLNDGKFENGDIPKRIMHCQKTENGIDFAIKWNPRTNGTIPRISVYSNIELRKRAPSFLIDYYEQHLKFKKIKLL